MRWGLCDYDEGERWKGRGASVSRWSRSERAPVKRGAGLARHFEGWQVGLLAVFLAGSTAALAVPRSVAPVDLPPPRLDSRAIERIARHDEELAAGVDRQRLDIDVLQLGTAVFAYGDADASGDDEKLSRARRDLIDASARAMRVGPEPIVALRAHHLRTFLRELRLFERTGDESEELLQTGGGFLRLLRRNAWIEEDGRHRRILLQDAALRAAFKRRWNEVANLRGGAFELELDEARAFYAFLLGHPVLPPEGSTPIWATDARATAAGQYRLRKLEELAAIDPDYPADLARGVVLYQLRRYPLSVEAFRRHLEAHPDGPYALRAQNYLRAALERARD
jgi:tetratricopeptide (TPR) repeat protein